MSHRADKTIRQALFWSGAWALYATCWLDRTKTFVNSFQNPLMYGQVKDWTWMLRRTLFYNVCASNCDLVFRIQILFVTDICGTSTAIYYKMRGQVTKWTQNDIQTDWETDKQIVHEKIYFTYGKEKMTFKGSSKAHGKLSDWISYPNWAHTKDTVNPLNKTRQSHNWLQKLKKYK